MDFSSDFQKLTDHLPLPWQSRLYDRLYAGDIPRVCNIPTGLGKTMVIPIWLIALKHQQMAGEGTLPRRLVYIINRRTVVDQATEVVGQIRKVVEQIRPNKWTDPLAISTLRGELADNGEWRKDPSRPAIIVGTIDMVGSKLLFNGYGDGRYWRVHHAGLVGQDTLWVHDEAHITPAFSDLLHQVQREQKECHEMRPIHVMELTATPRSDQDVLRLEDDDRDHPIVKARITAEKIVKLHEVEKSKKGARIVELARRHASAKVLIYVQTPPEVKAIANKLRSELDKEQRGLAKSRGKKYKKPDSWDHRIAILNGRMRGYERDRMTTDNKVYRKFLNAESVDESIYLVCTSAGEVGIDIDADHMVCDMSPMDSMIQRLGRVNRRGGKQAQVDIVYEEEKKNTPSKVTCDILKRWGEFNGSPDELRNRLSKLTDTDLDAAFSSAAKPPPLDDIILDEWSMTSVRDIPSRLNVQQYLHGREDYIEMVQVVWRKEIDLFKEYGVTDARTLTDWFRMCPVRSRERLQVLLSEAKKEISKMAGSAVCIDTAGNAEWIKKLEDIDQDVSGCTLVLSPQSGCLDSSGMLDTSVQDEVEDVAAFGREPERGRRLEGIDRRSGRRWPRPRRLPERGRRLEGIDSPCPFDDDIPRSPDGKILWPERGRVCLRDEDERPAVELVLYMPALELPAERAAFKQPLEEHNQRIVEKVSFISKQLGLNDEITKALERAAPLHDTGKEAQILQRYARNTNDCVPLAKSKKYGNPRSLGGYRHEFGSLVRAIIDEGVDNELALHLIATHHGWGRPYFRENAYDREILPSKSWKIEADARRRFGRLQRRYGRWTLAWLESILRCADALASTKEE